MPYVNDLYQLPPGSYGGPPDTPISSGKYNTVLDDLAAANNEKRPIPAGGTDAETAVEANDNLNTTSSNMASAATVNMANASGVVVNITGTTTITSLGTVQSGALRVLVFAGILTLTHHVTSLILPGGANITTAAGDVATFRSKGGGNWVCVGYQRASGAPLSAPADASEAAKGLIQIATAAQIAAASSNVLAVTPGRLKDSLAWYTITYAASIPIAHTNGKNQQVTLTGNGAFLAPTGGIPGETLDIAVIQDGTGNRVPTWNSAFDFGDYGTPVLSTGAGQEDILGFKCRTSGKFVFYGMRRRSD